MSQDLHQFARPFDSQAWVAGAPAGCRKAGLTPEILKVDADGWMYGRVSGVVGYTRPAAMDWATNGSARHMRASESPFDLVMLPLFMIDGKPVFVGDEIQGAGEIVKAQAHFTNEAGLWRWPGAPRKVETRMTGDELSRAANEARTLEGELRMAANAAIARSIADGDVIPAEYFFGVPGAPGQTVYGSREAVKALEAFFLDCVTSAQADRWMAEAARRAFAAGQHSARSGTEHGMMYFETLLQSVKETK